MTDEIIKNIEKFGLKINHMLNHMNKKELENINQAIIEYQKNLQNSDYIDYMY
ncbi:MAG: hypothetical protein K5798_04395 [Nitrosopumilus sp.]|uniref:Uncharacterized protein n=1 Tax=Nitrosopumilus zosterae TaxID=718286 RepID=A0A2S2KQB2_9ARCH|nr:MULTISPECIES: hypothetical protein [Nitrosopumilus]MCV0366490.1 hypothetical protein [Nitrosopumilus sp.]BDQ31655.1 hypothetical protein NZOSNM25_001782 [Nitrosopumilus zosterae]GBH33862.1 hypothetical protein NZNM25_06530 [Nitrosopumilus zosterae]